MNLNIVLLDRAVYEIQKARSTYGDFENINNWKDAFKSEIREFTEAGDDYELLQCFCLAWQGLILYSDYGFAHIVQLATQTTCQNENKQHIENKIVFDIVNFVDSWEASEPDNDMLLEVCSSMLVYLQYYSDHDYITKEQQKRWKDNAPQ